MEPVQVKIHSFLNVYLAEEQVHRLIEVNLEPGQELTVAQLLQQFPIPREEVAIITINKKWVTDDTLVSAGDLVEFFPVVGGG